MKFQRLIEKQVKEALASRPAVLITGPRQVGKTTLAHEVCETGYTYVSLDNANELARANSDPIGFIRDFDRVIIDEVQHAPELFRTIKKSIDDDRRAGRFLLIGSTNILQNKRMSDSLAGRMRRINLLPLTQAEILGVEPTFIDRLFAGKFESHDMNILGDNLIRSVMAGGFPETIKMEENDRRSWTKNYLDAILGSDLKDNTAIHKLNSFSQLINKLALYSGKQINYSQLASNIGITYHTVKQYTTILEQMYLVNSLNPWFTNLLNRISKTPKVHFVDTGVLAALSGLDFQQLQKDREKFGYFLDSFVFSEVLKLLTVSDMWLTPYHFRENSKQEVDIVLERNDGVIAGIEVKASATVQPKDFTGLRKLSEVTGDNFAHGVVLYDGIKCMSYGDKLTAIPLSSLWG